MSIRIFINLMKPLFKKKNSAVPIAARRSILPMKNANTAVQDYKPKQKSAPIGAAFLFVFPKGKAPLCKEDSPIRGNVVEDDKRVT